MRPQRTRCTEWIMKPSGRPYAVRCGRPLTHRVVGRWKNPAFAGHGQRCLMCDRCAAELAATGSLHSSVTITAYRVRKGNR